VNICIITSMAGIGGTETASLRYAELLLRRGHRVTLVSGPGPLLEQATELGAAWINLDFYGDWLSYARSTLLLRRVLTRDRFDVLHCQMARPVPAATIANFLAFAPSAVIWHSRGLPTATYRRVCPLFDRIGVYAIGNCEHERAKLIRHGLRRERVGFTYNPLPTISPSGARRPRSDFVLGSLSRLSKERSVDEALHVLQVLRDRGCEAKLIIGGDGPEMPALRELCAKLRLESYVQFEGRVQDLDAFFSSIDVLVNTLHLEGDDGAGVGNNIIESALFRVPVVAYDSMGISELVVDGVTGFCVPVRDRAMFVERIHQLAENATLRELLGRQLSEHTSSLCSPERVHRDLLACYTAALGRGSR
jgi:L-malate glycosyltransferase